MGAGLAEEVGGQPQAGSNLTQPRWLTSTSCPSLIGPATSVWILVDL